MSERRRIFGEKFIDLGNFTIIALIFGQFAVESKSLPVIILGVIIVAVCWMMGFFLLKRERRRK